MLFFFLSLDNRALTSVFGLTANYKPWFAVNGFTLPVCPYLGLKIRGWQLAAAMFVFIHPLTSISVEKLSSKFRFYETEVDNQ